MAGVLREEGKDPDRRGDAFDDGEQRALGRGNEADAIGEQQHPARKLEGTEARQAEKIMGIDIERGSLRERQDRQAENRGEDGREARGRQHLDAAVIAGDDDGAAIEQGDGEAQEIAETGSPRRRHWPP